MSRKKLIITAVILTLILVIGGIIAYFTDVDTKVNKFKMGNVQIKVDEPDWPGNDIPDYVMPDIVPNKEIPKNPQVKNLGSTDVYAFVKVVVPYANIVVGNAAAAAETALFTYEVNKGWAEVGTEVKDTTAKTITHVYAYVGTENTSELEALRKNETTPTVFDTIKFVDVKENGANNKENGDDNSEIQNTELEVVVSGYGIQTTDLGIDSKAPADIWPLVEGAN